MVKDTIMLVFILRIHEQTTAVGQTTKE